MPDWFEFVYGFDSSNPDDAFGDADGDGLTNLREYSPGASDTDGDGMTDGYEVQHGLDPMVYNANLKDVMIGLQILAGMDANPAESHADADKKRQNRTQRCAEQSADSGRYEIKISGSEQFADSSANCSDPEKRILQKKPVD